MPNKNVNMVHSFSSNSMLLWSVTWWCNRAATLPQFLDSEKPSQLVVPFLNSQVLELVSSRVKINLPHYPLRNLDISNSERSIEVFLQLKHVSLLLSSCNCLFSVFTLWSNCNTASLLQIVNYPRVPSYLDSLWCIYSRIKIIRENKSALDFILLAWDFIFMCIRKLCILYGLYIYIIILI